MPNILIYALAALSVTGLATILALEVVRRREIDATDEAMARIDADIDARRLAAAKRRHLSNYGRNA